MRPDTAMRAVEVRVEAVGSTVVAAALALAGGAIWAVLLSTDSLLAQPLSVPGSMTAGLLLASSYPAWSLSRASDAGSLLFPALLILVSFSELLALQHDVQAASGVDWQALYMPALLFTLAVGWRAHGGSAPTALTRNGLRLAAYGWVSALLIEAFQWSLGEGAPHYAQIANVKDVIEVLSAAALFLSLSMLDRLVTLRPTN